MTLSHQINTMYMLWLRQMKRSMRSRARVISSVAQPLLFLLAFGFGFGPIYQKASGGNYIDFLAPGIIAMSILFTAMFMGLEVIWDRQFGFLKETLVAPISRLTIMIGRTLGGATVAAAQGVIVFLITLFVGFRPVDPVMLLMSLLFVLMIAVLFTAFGTAIASLMEDMQAFPVIMNFLVMPLFFLSGAIFPLDGVPSVLKMISQLNPLSYGVDAIRGSLNGVYYFGFWTDFFVLAGSIAVVFGIGSYLFSKIEV